MRTQHHYRLRWYEANFHTPKLYRSKLPSFAIGTLLLWLDLPHYLLSFPFLYCSRQIWVRNYQIIEQKADNALEAHLAKKKTGGDESTTSLVEIGPRFVLNPIRIFRGSFGGQALFHNSDFVTPNKERALDRLEKGNSYKMRKDAQQQRKMRKEELVLPEDPLDSVFR